MPYIAMDSIGIDAHMLSKLNKNTDLNVPHITLKLDNSLERFTGLKEVMMFMVQYIKEKG
jgi:hypothetical protein